MQALAVLIVLTVIIITSLALVRVSLAGSDGVWGRRGVPPAGPPEPGFSPPPQSNLMVPVLIGCPPGKRLAFDITYTVQYNRAQNKHYFDCVKVDPEMPCFLFRDSGCPAPSPLPSPALPACPLTAPTHPLLFLWVFHLSSFPSLISPPGLHPSDPTVFYPFFLIQDLVTGDSGSFQGR